MSDVKEDKSAKLVQVVCFKLAEEEYAIDITRVQEVIRMQTITEVPQMPEFVLGVVNIRGKVVPVFDLRLKFKLKQKSFDDLTKILVVSVNDNLISFIVDEILDNIKLDASVIDQAPTVKMEIERDCVKGVALLDERMITILDIDRVNDGVNAEIETYDQ